MKRLRERTPARRGCAEELLSNVALAPVYPVKSPRLHGPRPRVCAAPHLQLFLLLMNHDHLSLLRVLDRARRPPRPCSPSSLTVLAVLPHRARRPPSPCSSSLPLAGHPSASPTNSADVHPSSLPPPTFSPPTLLSSCGVDRGEAPGGLS